MSWAYRRERTTVSCAWPAPSRIWRVPRRSSRRTLSRPSATAAWIANYGRAEGENRMKEAKFFQELLEEGRTEGRVEGLRTALLNTLEVRFGPASAAELADALRN